MFLIGIWSFLKFGRSPNEEVHQEDWYDKTWSVFTSFGDLKIEQRYLGEVRFGPVFIGLKSKPFISSLENKTFGDWFHLLENGVLLQQWNSTDTPDTNLIYIDGKTLKLKTIKENIPSVLWTVESVENRVKLSCDTGREILTYKIEV